MVDYVALHYCNFIFLHSAILMFVQRATFPPLHPALVVRVGLCPLARRFEPPTLAGTLDDVEQSTPVFAICRGSEVPLTCDGSAVCPVSSCPSSSDWSGGEPPSISKSSNPLNLHGGIIISSDLYGFVLSRLFFNFGPVGPAS